MAGFISERRRFPRISLKSPLRFRARGEQKVRSAVSADISLGGTSFLNDGFIIPETIVALEINLLSKVVYPIARIVQSWHLTHSDRYRIGVEFLELNALDRNYLSDYIDMQGQIQTQLF